MRFKGWMIVPVLVAAGISPASALTESSAREMELADEATYNRILATPDGESFLGSKGKVYARHLEWQAHSFLIVRVENDDCSGEYCSTAIISATANGDRIVGIGWLPKRIRQSDIQNDWCRVCGPVFSLSFEDSDQRSITIGVSRDYVVLSGMKE